MAEALITKERAKRIWIQAQGLHRQAVFGRGPAATLAAVEQLGYVQIDTIHVIERCHHHILYTRIPDYRRADLHRAQSIDKTIFEYWTHALSYVPTRDFRFYLRDMRRYAREPGRWLSGVKKVEMDKVLRLIRHHGALSIRDIEDDVLIEKEHEWASRKPSKKALQLGFYSGRLAISERQGMLKKYELAERHFDWIEKPRPASETEIIDFMINRALRAQGLVSLDSICHLIASRKPRVEQHLAARVRRGELVPVRLRGLERVQFWTRTETLDQTPVEPTLVHLLSPFDPLVIQRKRLAALFDYEHRFEAYLPKEKRVFGYFGLPVLWGDQIIAVMDLKTDRAAKRLLLQKWTWLPKQKSATNKRRVEDALHRFAAFQLAL